MALQYASHRITGDEYHRMGAASVFPHDARIELIEGALFERIVPMNEPQARHPAADEIVAVIEIADSSRDFDIGQNIPMYEVWRSRSMGRRPNRLMRSYL